MIQFIKNENFINGANELIKQLKLELIKNPVLWIISGGSNIQIEKYILDHLDKKYLSNLEIILADERFVPPNDPNSNYNQLIKSGFKQDSLNFEPILSNLNLAKTKETYLSLLEKKLSRCPLVIGQFGIGADGHTLGILPFSETINSTDKIVCYTGKDFTRLSLSLNFIKKRINYGYIFCFGKDKKTALSILNSDNDDINHYPSLIFQQIKGIKLYNEYIGG